MRRQLWFPPPDMMKTRWRSGCSRTFTPCGTWNIRGPPGGKQLTMGSSLRSVRWRYSYKPFAQLWKGATLPASPRLAKSPLAFMPISPAVVSTRLPALGFAQYPVSPGAAPSLGWPSGHLGAGFDAPTGRGADRRAPLVGADKRFPLATITVLACANFVPSRARLPSTVTRSPTWSDSRLQPLFFNSEGLASSRAQLAILPRASWT